MKKIKLIQVNVTLEFTKEEVKLIKNPKLDDYAYTSTKDFNFTNEDYNNICITLVRKHIIESGEIGYPLQPDLGIRLTGLGKQVRDNLKSQRRKNKPSSKLVEN